jgi:hypothetical protein
MSSSGTKRSHPTNETRSASTSKKAKTPKTPKTPQITETPTPAAKKQKRVVDSEEEEEEEEEQVVQKISKGKGKEKEVEMEEEVAMEEEADAMDEDVNDKGEESGSDEDDIEIDTGGLNFNKTIGQKSAPGANWITTFENVTPPLYADHMAPFRRRISTLQAAGESQQTINAEIKDRLRGQAKKIFVAATGNETNPHALRLVREAIIKVAKQRPVNIVSIPGSAWMIVEMEQKRSIAKMIEQGVVFNAERCCLVIFRKVNVVKGDIRMVEIKNVRGKNELIELEKVLKDEEGATVIEKTPAIDGWSVNYEERIIWKIKAKDNEWEMGTNINLPMGGRIIVTYAPICDICHSDGHHKSSCTWIPYLRAAKEERRRNRM